MSGLVFEKLDSCKIFVIIIIHFICFVGITCHYIVLCYLLIALSLVYLYKECNLTGKKVTFCPINW